MRQPLVQFLADDSVDDLEHVVFQEGSWTNIFSGPLTDVDADDEITSMILIGVPGKQVRMWLDAGFGGENLRVATGTEMWASLTTLRFTDQTGANSFIHPQGATVVVSGTFSGNYSNEIGAIQFV